MKQWTDERWREHEKKLEGINLENRYSSAYHDYLKETQSQEEHPEWYESPCLCQLCCSYGD